MKIYATILGATALFKTSTMPGVVRAEDKESAEKKAMDEAYRTYPPASGWGNHYVQVVQVPDAWVMEAARPLDNR